MKPIASRIRIAVLTVAGVLTLTACTPDEDTKYPKDPERARKEQRGKITGEEGISLGGPSEKEKEAGKNPLGVNSFLWRATLDTLAFLPITTADPFGGTILTDWYEDAAAPGERYKVNVLILDRQLRADSLKITTFRQKKDAKSEIWADASTDATLGRKLEDTVLTRARELRVKQLGY